MTDKKCVPTLGHAGQKLLLELAHESVESGIGRVTPAAFCDHHPHNEVAAPLRESQATFVTLRIDGVLRGCCGSVTITRSLAEDVWCNAFASAFRDHRMPDIAKEELDDLNAEISILSPMEELDVATQAELASTLRPDVDGVMVSMGDCRATYLPGVWKGLPEPAVFLAELKMKAGLDAGFWSPELRWYRYTTQCFSD